MQIEAFSPEMDIVSIANKKIPLAEFQDCEAKRDGGGEPKENQGNEPLLKQWGFINAEAALKTPQSAKECHFPNLLKVYLVYFSAIRENISFPVIKWETQTDWLSLLISVQHWTKWLTKLEALEDFISKWNAMSGINDLFCFLTWSSKAFPPLI